MAISNELSSDVAAALLSQNQKETKTEKKDLVRIVRDLHSVLRSLGNDVRRRRERSLPFTTPQPERAARFGPDH